MAQNADNTFILSKLTKDRVPALPFALMKQTVLGKTYDLSLVIIGDAKSKKLNQTYRNKTYIPNVLSFSIDPLHGEIFLNLKQAKREHASHEMNMKNFVALLVIHSMLHLKGMQHGSKMDKEVDRILKVFGVEVP